MSSPLQERFALAAARWPERLAVVDPARDGVIRYSELAALVRDFAALLARHGVTPGQRVGLLGAKSIPAVAAILATLACEAAYVPADPNAPVARAAARFRDARVAAVVIDEGRVAGFLAAWNDEPLERCELLGAGLVLLRSSRQAAASPGTAYILYTSGSTGEPKGVVHTHASAGAFVDWCSATFAPGPDDRFSSHAPFCFDLSILDLFVPLTHGAAVVLIGEAQAANPLALTAILGEQAITVWYSTPSVLRLLLAHGGIEQCDARRLRFVLFAGEVFAPAHVARLRALWPAARFFNLYGPTETNVCTAFEVTGPADPGRTAHPIGRVIDCDATHVVPRDGDVGELLVSGATVMAGYWQRPDLDARAFDVDAEGRRWYRTGDLVALDAAGDYLFAGRADRMVKRLGNRVELGEIETVLYRHPAIAETALVARADPDQGVSLRAFVCWRSPDGAPPSIIALKRFCAERLPLYMVPDRFSFLDSLPKTATDKIDYARLEVLDG